MRLAASHVKRPPPTAEERRKVARAFADIVTAMRERKGRDSSAVPKYETAIRLMAEFRSFVGEFRQMQRKDGRLDRGLQHVEQQLEALRSGIRGRRHEALAKAYYFSQKFSEDDYAWTLFCQADFWKGGKQGPTSDKRSDALRFVLRMACGREANALKAANQYYRALSSLPEHMNPHDIPDAIVAGGGVRKLAARDRGKRVVADDPAKPFHKEVGSGANGHSADGPGSSATSVASKALGVTKLEVVLHFEKPDRTLLRARIGEKGSMNYEVLNVSGRSISLKVYRLG